MLARGELNEATYHIMPLHHNKMMSEWERLTEGIAPAMPTLPEAN